MGIAGALKKAWLSVQFRFYSGEYYEKAVASIKQLNALYESQYSHIQNEADLINLAKITVIARETWYGKRDALDFPDMDAVERMLFDSHEGIAIALESAELFKKVGIQFLG